MKAWGLPWWDHIRLAQWAHLEQPDADCVRVRDDKPTNRCAHCLEPIPAHKRWCSDSCFRAEDHYEDE